MDIPIQQQSDDIYAFGFDKNLNRGGSTPPADTSNPTVYNSVDGSVPAQNVQFGAILTGVGNSMLVADPTKGFWIGNAQYASAPFRVNMQGDVSATSLTLSGYVVINQGTFGGNGADGALSVASGTTNIDLGSAATFIKNYTSIAITGTGAITFSNPHADGTVIILKSQGAVTITSSATRAIDVRSLGCTGGAGGTTGNRTGGVIGNDSPNYIDALAHGGDIGSSGSSNGGAGGLTIASGIGVYATSAVNVTATKWLLMTPGSGGGGGNTDSAEADGEAGGRGAGCLLIECNGAYNVTGTIDLAGTAGTAAPAGAGGGGGGGGGGMYLGMYRTLTADSGTYTVTGGSGGAGGSSGGTGGGGGGGGGTPIAAGTAGSNGTGSAGGAGGAGAAGVAIRMVNNVFA